MRDHTACPNDGLLANGHATQDRGIAANGCATLDQCRDALPVVLRLQVPLFCYRPRVSIVDEHHSVADEDAVFNSHTLTNKGMAGNLHPAADSRPFLDLDKGTNLALVTNFTAIQVDVGINLDISAQFHIGCDAHKIHVYHRLSPLSRH